MNEFGEPNMGNPSVRFDEGRRASAKQTTAVSLIRSLSLCLLYQKNMKTTRNGNIARLPKAVGARGFRPGKRSRVWDLGSGERRDHASGRWVNRRARTPSHGERVQVTFRHGLAWRRAAAGPGGHSRAPKWPSARKPSATSGGATATLSQSHILDKPANCVTLALS